MRDEPCATTRYEHIHDTVQLHERIGGSPVFTAYKLNAIRRDRRCCERTL